jgi:HEAT repeat protein
MAFGRAVQGSPPPRETVELLLRAARDDADGSVRLQAVSSLVTSGAATPALLAGIANDNPDVRVQQRAVQMLAQIDSDDARGRLADIAEKHPTAAVRRTALQLIATLVTR